MKPTTLKTVIITVFHLVIAAYAVFLIVGSFSNLVHAQNYTQRDYRIEGIERRIADLDALKLEERLVRIETILTNIQDRNWWDDAANGGVGLLLARALYLAVRKRSTE